MEKIHCCKCDPADLGSPKAVPSVSLSVPFCPGIDLVDLYSRSETSQIWKNGVVAQCLVPVEVIGWEFYSLLWPQPAGCVPLRIMDSIELLAGRQPGASCCSSVVFAFIPKGYAYEVVDGRVSKFAARPSIPHKTSNPRQRQLSGLVRTMERHCNNIDTNGKSIAARLVALFPGNVHRDEMMLPNDPNWGLFIASRSRSLVLLNKERGRIDLGLATLLGMDAAFSKLNVLVEATAALFKPFGSDDRVSALFGDLDPMKMHSGFTNALMVENYNVGVDGRLDYLRLFKIRCPTFFVSNSSENLCFLTPQEAARHRVGDDEFPTTWIGRWGTRSSAGDGPLPKPRPLPDLPCWTTEVGKFGLDAQTVLAAYRTDVCMRVETGAYYNCFPSIGRRDRSGRGIWFSPISACSKVGKTEEVDKSTKAIPVAMPNGGRGKFYEESILEQIGIGHRGGASDLKQAGTNDGVKTSDLNQEGIAVHVKGDTSHAPAVSDKNADNFFLYEIKFAN